MYWCFSENWREEAVVKRCDMVQYKGDTSKDTRYRILIDIMTYSIKGMYFKDIEYLHRLIGYSKKQIEIVWKICIDEHILMFYPEKGYSALDWMIDRKHFIPERMRKTSNKKASKPNNSFSWTGTSYPSF